jgi:hypothetical protein
MSPRNTRLPPIRPPFRMLCHSPESMSQELGFPFRQERGSNSANSTPMATNLFADELFRNVAFPYFYSSSNCHIGLECG